ncbi:hypothetical protein [Halomonas colorata]|uniref:Uncharacterized protein n=1 Tax=Halomonas colorata TaxID=2742615 RepID=A0ABR9G0J5_9GAMM|nr:hypothetical protein [Halomonas colorata]MBE0464402.1 hypothetical protein [Halomonas colorata]
MSINDDEFMMQSSCYHDRLEMLVNALASDLKRELREILLSEVGKSHFHIALLIEKLVREVSGSDKNKENFLHLVGFGEAGYSSKGSEPDDEMQSLIKELNSLRSENLILKQWVSELKGKSKHLPTCSKQEFDVELSIRSQPSYSERALGLDFSLLEERNKS